MKLNDGASVDCWLAGAVGMEHVSLLQCFTASLQNLYKMPYAVTVQFNVNTEWCKKLHVNILVTYRNIFMPVNRINKAFYLPNYTTREIARRAVMERPEVGLWD